MHTEDAVRRLHSRLPLRERQEQLDEILRSVHRGILQSFIDNGRPLNRSEIGDMVEDVDGVLERLGKDDLIVLSSQGKEAVGAYPMTLENTPHRLKVNGHNIHAICALDALSVAPMFDTEVQIDSRCHVTGTAISIRQSGREILSAQPSSDVQVGIRWQNPSGVAAHSMCMEMIFLKDRKTGEQWQGGDTENITLFMLPEAIAFGAEFFLPLVNA